MINLNNTTEMNLTSREIRMIAFEAEGVDIFNTNFLGEFSGRTFNMILKGSSSLLSPSYVVRRCYFIVNGKKLN